MFALDSAAWFEATQEYAFTGIFLRRRSILTRCIFQSMEDALRQAAVKSAVGLTIPTVFVAAFLDDTIVRKANQESCT